MSKGSATRDGALATTGNAAEVVIVTHRDLVAHAPQPLHLARAIRDRGIGVHIVSIAPDWRRRELAAEGLSVTGTPPGLEDVRLRFGLMYAQAIRHLRHARIGIAFDLTPLPAFALAHRLFRFDSVLYWLEPFYGDYAETSPTLSARLGQRARRLLSPPDVLVDVHERRIEISRPLSGNPERAFVVHNTPPLRSEWNVGAPEPRMGPVRLVYAGSVRGLGEEGVRLLLEAMGRVHGSTTLDIFPAEGRARATHIDALVHALRLTDRVRVRDAVPRAALPSTLAGYDVGVVLYPVRDGQNINSRLAAPNKLYEYFACGLAVLASANETLSFVDTEGLGWRVSGASPDALAARLRQLEDRASVDACRARAHAAFVDRYHFEREAAGLLDWIHARARQSLAVEAGSPPRVGAGMHLHHATRRRDP